jgi:hypothetical protein
MSQILLRRCLNRLCNCSFFLIGYTAIMKIRWWHRQAGRTMLLAGIIAVLVGQVAVASPFGQGIFGADVPFGSATSLSLALTGTVNVGLTPSGGNFVGSGTHTLTVTTTDVVGYRLYLYAPNTTAMVNGSETIAASNNVTAAALALNTWGYNTDSSTNYVGVTNLPAVIKDANGPYKNGDVTTVKYGVYASSTTGAGTYSVPVVYTAVAKSQ